MGAGPALALAGPRERGRLARGLAQPPAQAARFLLGQLLVRRRGGRETVVRIVETEAYLGARDPAAHAYRGRTPRNAPLFGPPGTLYVYLVYGLHHCLNLSVDAEGVPGCVLIRGAEPQPGAALGPRDCRGPGRLCRSLGIDARLSGRHLFDPRAGLTLREGRPPAVIGVSPRVGISAAVAWPLRFFDADSAAVSAAPRAGRSRETR